MSNSQYLDSQQNNMSLTFDKLRNPVGFGLVARRDSESCWQVGMSNSYTDGSSLVYSAEVVQLMSCILVGNRFVLVCHQSATTVGLSFRRTSKSFGAKRATTYVISIWLFKMVRIDVWNTEISQISFKFELEFSVTISFTFAIFSWRR